MRADRFTNPAACMVLGCGWLLAASGCHSQATVNEEVYEYSDSIKVSKAESVRMRSTDSLVFLTEAEFDSVEVKADSSGVTVRARAVRVKAAGSRCEATQTAVEGMTRLEAGNASERTQITRSPESFHRRGRALPWWMYPALALIIFILIKKHTRL